MSALLKCLQSLNTVYRSTLRFVTGDGGLTRHCDLYIKSGVLCSLSLMFSFHIMPLVLRLRHVTQMSRARGYI